MSRFAELKAEYISLAGKNPPPMSAEKLQAKVDELNAAAAAASQTEPVQDPPAQDPPAQDPPAQDPPAQDPPAQDQLAQVPPVQAPPAQEPAAEQSVEKALASLGLVADEQGEVEVEMLAGLSGPDICLSPRDRHRCGAAEAVRLVRAGFARAGGSQA